MLRTLALCVVATAFSFPTQAEAATITFLSSPSAFSGSQTTLTFVGAPTSFSSYGGVSFDLIGTTADPVSSSDVTPGRSGPAESTSMFTCVGSPCPNLQVGIGTAINRFGFDGRVNPGDNFAFTLFAGASSIASFTMPGFGSSLYHFYAFESDTPFDSVLIDIAGLSNGASALDNVMFEAIAPTAVPEPTSLLLFGSGMATLAAKARRRKKQQTQ